VRNLNGLLSLAHIAWGVSSFILAAASSIARGSPSNLAQISATAGAFSLVKEKSAFTARARSMKSLMDSYLLSVSIGGRYLGSASSTKP
ncbi:MAG TPA: hypothetical protein VK902_19710, partial [Rubrobacter sp.]|nr:hypothetical protein [Rubrobacter sp.]